MYRWREMSEQERAEILAARRRARQPWHSPPHWHQDGPARYHLTAACYEHAPHIGRNPARMDAFADDLLAACAA